MTKAEEHERAIAEAIPALAAAHRARLAGGDVGAGPREGSGSGPSGAAGGTPVNSETLDAVLARSLGNRTVGTGSVERPGGSAQNDRHRVLKAGAWTLAIGLSVVAILEVRKVSRQLNEQAVQSAKHLLVIK
jgi:hypothetical protein